MASCLHQCVLTSTGHTMTFKFIFDIRNYSMIYYPGSGKHSFHSSQILLPAASNSSIHHQAIDGRHCKVLCNHEASKNLKGNADFIRNNMDSKIIVF